MQSGGKGEGDYTGTSSGSAPAAGEGVLFQPCFEEPALAAGKNRRARRAREQSLKAGAAAAAVAVQPCAAAVQRAAGPLQQDLPEALASASALVAARQREQVQARVAVALGERRLAFMQEALSKLRAVFGEEEEEVFPAVQLVPGVVGKCPRVVGKLTGGGKAAGGAEAKTI